MIVGAWVFSLLEEEVSLGRGVASLAGVCVSGGPLASVGYPKRPLIEHPK